MKTRKRDEDYSWKAGERTMKVAAVIAGDGQTVMPLLEGERIRIRNIDSKEEFEIENPGLSVAGGKRMVIVKALLELGVDTVVTPPESFCAHSYGVAKANEIRFWRVSAGSKWETLWNGVDTPSASALSLELPEAELASHHHHHH